MAVLILLRRMTNNVESYGANCHVLAFYASRELPFDICRCFELHSLVRRRLNDESLFIRQHERTLAYDAVDSSSSSRESSRFWPVRGVRVQSVNWRRNRLFTGCALAYVCFIEPASGLLEYWRRIAVLTCGVLPAVISKLSRGGSLITADLYPVRVRCARYGFYRRRPRRRHASSTGRCVSFKFRTCEPRIWRRRTVFADAVEGAVIRRATRQRRKIHALSALTCTRQRDQPECASTRVWWPSAAKETFALLRAPARSCRCKWTSVSRAASTAIPNDWCLIVEVWPVIFIFITWMTSRMHLHHSASQLLKRIRCRCSRSVASGCKSVHRVS